MTRRRIAVSDIHGCADTLGRLLGLVGYEEGRDRLLLLGDYVDNGWRSKETVEAIMRLAHEGDAVILRGNHDDLFARLMTAGASEAAEAYMRGGGARTMQSYIGYEAWRTAAETGKLEEARRRTVDLFPDHFAFLGKLPLYAEEAGHLFVHAGIDPDEPDWRRQADHTFMNIGDRFVSSSPRSADEAGAAPPTVVFGHTRTQLIHGSSDVWFGPGKIGIDGGCAYGGRLNALVIGKDGSYRVVYAENADGLTGAGCGEPPDHRLRGE